MNLLVINYVMDENHGALGWQPKVVAGLAAICEKVVVVTSEIGTYHVPDNVTVTTVPRRPLGIPNRLGGKYAFNWHVYRLCKKHNIDAVFIHMAARWTYILRPAFRLLGVPVAVWYAHGTVSNELKRAIRSADRLLTSTPEGCRVDSPKVRVIGQGVDTTLFDIPAHRTLRDVLCVGRVSPRKRIDLLVDTAAALSSMGTVPEFQLQIVGPVLTMQDVGYDQKLRARVYDEGLQDKVRFQGYIPMEHSPKLYESAFVHLNVSETGSMDKTVMEALACGCPVLTSNPAFFHLLNDYPDFIITDDSPQAIAAQIEHIYGNSGSYDPLELRALVVGAHDLASYPRRVLDQLEPLVKR